MSSISQWTRLIVVSLRTIWQSAPVPMRMVDDSRTVCFPASGPDFTVTAHFANSIDVGRPSRRYTRVGAIGFPGAPPDTGTAR